MTCANSLIRAYSETIYADRALCSSRDHGIRGLGGELVRRCEELSKTRGCTHAVAYTTGKYSKAVFEALGYDSLKSVDYFTFRDGYGQLYLKDTREHTEAVAFIKKY